MPRRSDSTAAPEPLTPTANDAPAEFGGAALDLQGGRMSPGIRYLRSNGAFHFDAEGTPTGGFFWDGRAASLEAQAAGPFLNPVEMAMPSKAAVVAQLRQATYAGQFAAVFGRDVFDDVERAYAAITIALAQFQREDAGFAAFTSKYDAYLAGRAQLTAQEARGPALFEDQAKGNCAACHPSRPVGGQPPLFTDFTCDALPAGYHGNVNTSEPPYDRRPGDAPALGADEIDDVVAFLRTLTDGWSPGP